LASVGLSGFANALRGLSYGLSDLNSNLGTTGYTLGQFLGAAAGAGAAFGLFVTATKSAVTQSADLQYALVQMQIAISDGQQYANALATAVINIGNASVFTHTQVAQTFTQLGEMGFTAEQILNGVGQAAVNMSIAMGIDGTQGAALLGQSLQVYNANAKDATNYSDILTRSFYDSGVGADGLQQAISQAGGMAHKMGISFSDFMTVIDLMSRSMGSGSKAGTSLRYALGALTKPTTAEMNELDRLGIVTINKTAPALDKLTEKVMGASAAALQASGSWDGTVKGLDNIYVAGQKAGKIPLDVSFLDWANSSGVLNDKLYDSSGHFLGLKNAIDQIMTGLKGMSPEQIQEVMSSLFNVRGGQGMDQMVGLLGTFDTKYQAIYSDITKTGTAQDDANKLLHTAKGRWDQLSTTMNSFMSQVGGPINDVLMGIYGGVNNIVSAASNSQPVKDFFSIFLPMGAILSGVALGFLLVWGAIAIGLGPVLVPFLIVFSALMVAAGLLAGALTIIQTGFDSVGKTLSPLSIIFTPIKDFFTWAWNWITTNLGPALKKLGVDWNTVGTILLLVVLSPLIVVAAALLIIAAAILIVIIAIILFIQFLGWLKDQLLKLALWLVEHWYDFVAWAAKVVNGIQTTLSNIPTVVGGVFAATKRTVVAVFDAMVLAAVNWEASFVSSIVLGFNKAYMAVVTWGLNTEASIVTALMKFKASIDAFIGRIVKAWDDFWTWVAQRAQAAWNAITGIFNAASNSMLQGLEANMSAPMRKKFEQLIQDSQQSGKNVGTAFASGVSNPFALGAVAQAANSLVQTLMNHMGFQSPTKEGPGRTADTWAPNFITMFANGLLNGRGVIRAAASQVALALQQGLAPGAASLAALGSLNVQAASYAGAAGMGGTNTFVIQVGSKEVGRVVLDQVRHQLQMSGGARLQRK
jgi:hypothetical protein